MENPFRRRKKPKQEASTQVPLIQQGLGATAIQAQGHVEGSRYTPVEILAQFRNLDPGGKDEDMIPVFADMVRLFPPRGTDFDPYADDKTIVDQFIHTKKN